MYNMVFSEEVVKEKNNYFRNYKLVCENILDVILEFGDEELGGITSDQITNYIGIRPSCIRRYLARMMNRENAKKYFSRKRSGSFKYYNTSVYNPVNAYKDIMNSNIEKVTLNQTGLKNSEKELPFDYEVFPNVMNVLKKSKGTWMSVCDIAEELGVNHKQGKSTIKEELNRDLKCTIKFVEVNEESDVKKYRLVYKYWKHSISDLKEIAHRSFPQDKPHKISGHNIQALNEISKMKKGLRNVR